MEQMRGRAYIRLPVGVAIGRFDRIDVERLVRGLEKRGFEIHRGPKFRGPEPAPFLYVEGLNDTELLRSAGLKDALEDLARL